MGLAEVFAEERSFSVQHVFIPAAIYYYTQNIYKFFTIIFLFESFEYLFGQLDHRWSENAGDSLVGDILMACLGLLAVRQFPYEEHPLWYIALHIIVLALASAVTVTVLVDEITWAYVYYGLIASIMGVFISREWAVFSFVNILIISFIATKAFTSDFSYTPVATLTTVASTSAILTVYRYLN